MHGADAAAFSRANASYGAAVNTGMDQRERDRAETALYR
jgi:hypothetical protein